MSIEELKIAIKAVVAYNWSGQLADFTDNERVAEWPHFSAFGGVGQFCQRHCTRARVVFD
jgi:hypothetical protein